MSTLLNFAKQLKSKLNQWEDNPIVGRAKKAADMVSKMIENALELTQRFV